ncbi:MAG TPA: hypothetical protein VFC39_22735 [Acidobacteriaceae bacterium]|nr:hypothetical protein [Acidobacteriaceae bacterium]
MPSDHNEINRNLGISLQIELLQRSLQENERSWIASGLGMIHNTFADSIRRDIAEKEATLAD